MCIHIYYAHIILSNLQEKLETLVKIKMGYSFSSSYNYFGLHAPKEKKMCSYIDFANINTSTCIHKHIHKRYLLAFAYKHNYSHKNKIITFYV